MFKKLLLIVWFISFYIISYCNQILVCEENNIKVYEQWVIINNIKVKERTGIMTLKCSAKDVILLIPNVDKWMKYVEANIIIYSENKGEWYQYTTIRAPWPFGDQNIVSYYQIKKESENITKVIIKT